MPPDRTLAEGLGTQQFDLIQPTGGGTRPGGRELRTRLIGCPVSGSPGNEKPGNRLQSFDFNNLNASRRSCQPEDGLETASLSFGFRFWIYGTSFRWGGAAAGGNRRSRHGGDDMSGRMSIPEIARRLGIGRLAVYAMLEQGLLPGIHLGRRWIVTRHAY